MITIPNQPINFNQCKVCDCKGAECQAGQTQIAKFTDYFSFQVTDFANLVEDEILMLNGDWYGDFENGVLAPYWANDATIGVTPWALNNVAPIAGTWDAETQLNSQRLYNLIPFTAVAGNFYSLTLLHDLSLLCELDVYVSNDLVTWTLLTTILGSTTLPYNFIASQNFQYIGFVLNNTTCEGTRHIDNVSLRTIDWTKFQIYNCCDNTLIDYLDPTKFSIDGNNISFKDKWSSYVSALGFYRICAVDENIFSNADFANTPLTNDWTFDGNGVAFAAATIGSKSSILATSGVGLVSELVSQQVQLDPNCSNTFTFNSYVSSDTVTYTLYGDGEILGTVQNNIVGGWELLTISFESDIFIDYLGLTITYPGAGIDAYVTDFNTNTDFCSDCVEVRTTYDCSLLMTATQTANAFDLDFSGGHTMYLRVNADKYKSNPEFERINTKSSSELYSRIFTDLDFLEELKVYLSPGYVLTALAVMSSLRTFKIDGVQYVFKEGNWELDWDERREYASTITEIYKAQQVGQNTY